MRQIYVESYFKGFKKLVNYSLLKDHPQRDVIEKRLKIIDFFDAYGKEATKDAFQVSRSTVYLWKKKLKNSEGKVSSLAPKSKAPRARRKRVTNPSIMQFIKDRMVQPRPRGISHLVQHQEASQTSKEIATIEVLYR